MDMQKKMEFIAHQIINAARDLMSASTTLDISRQMGKLNTEDEVLIRLLCSMKVSTENLLRLTNWIRNFDEMDKHRQCQLKDAVQYAYSLCSVSIAEGDIEFMNEINPDLDLIVDITFSDASLLLATLVSNAKDAVNKLGPHESGQRFIRVAAEDQTDFVICRVIDGGTGVEEEYRDKLFVPGFTTKPRHDGKGLSMAAEVLEKNGGTIELTDPGPGTTTFTVIFPKPKIEL